MTLHTHPEWQALLAGICAEPYDDLRRLVAADWLTEHGEEEYGEFIRLQCEKTKLVEAKACKAYAAGRCCRSVSCPLCPLHRRETDLSFMGRGLPDWFRRQADETYHLPGAEPPAGPACTLRRGFVDVVRAPLSWLIGGEQCNDCLVVAGHRWCDTCHGTGRTPGHLDELVKVHPITRVVATDADSALQDRDGVFWWRDDEIYDHGMLLIPAAVCPKDDYPTREAALDALSAALLNPARERAGLPPLHPAATLEVAR
jgi:uncharacterized protein (TIGR02996 family)